MSAASENNLLDIRSERHHLTVDRRSLTSTSLDRHDLSGDDADFGHFRSDQIRHNSQLHRQGPVSDLDDDECYNDIEDIVDEGSDLSEKFEDDDGCSQYVAGEESNCKSVEREKKKSDVEEIIKIKEEHLRKLELLSAPQGPGFSHTPSILFDEVEELREELATYRKFLTQQSISDLTCKPSETDEDDTDSSEGSMSPTSSSYEQPPSPQTVSESLVPKTSRVVDPLQGHFRAYLPNDQRTVIKCQPKQSLGEALRKKMSQRAFEIDLYSYVVYKKDSRDKIKWDTDISTLDSAEIVVELPVEDSLLNNTHQFVRKTSFRFTNCDVCKKLLFSGYRCSQCGWRFHPKCSLLVPQLCTSFEDEDS